MRHIKEKSPNTWKLNNIPQNNQYVKEDISRGIRKFFEINNMKIQKQKVTSYSQNSVYRKVYRIKCAC